MYPDST